MKKPPRPHPSPTTDIRSPELRRLFKDIWVLDGRTPRKAKSFEEFAEFLGKDEERRVALTGTKKRYVSTVFIGANSRALFETLAFIDGQPGRCLHADDWEQAERNHRAVCHEMGLTP